MTRMFGNIVVGLLMAFAGAPAFAQNEPPKAPPEPKAETKPEAKPMPKTNPRVKLETTLGNIVVELDAAKAPISTENFLQYVRDKFFDGTIFHRVIPTFMIQGGGYLPSMDEKKDGLRPAIKNEWQNGLKNVRGTIAMARTSLPDSATAQFYINVKDNPNLDQPSPAGGNAAYTVFGTVVEGMDVVDKIKDTETKLDPKYASGGKVVPVTPIIINAAKLLGEEAKPAGK